MLASAADLEAAQGEGAGWWQRRGKITRQAHGAGVTGLPGSPGNHQDFSLVLGTCLHLWNRTSVWGKKGVFFPPMVQ